MTPGGVILTGGIVHPMLAGDTTTAEAVRLDGRRITHVGSLGDACSLGDADMVDLEGAGAVLAGDFYRFREVVATLCSVPCGAKVWISTHGRQLTLCK